MNENLSFPKGANVRDYERLLSLFVEVSPFPKIKDLRFNEIAAGMKKKSPSAVCRMLRNLEKWTLSDSETPYVTRVERGQYRICPRLRSVLVGKALSEDIISLSETGIWNLSDDAAIIGIDETFFGEENGKRKKNWKDIPRTNLMSTFRLTAYEISIGGKYLANRALTLKAVERTLRVEPYWRDVMKMDINPSLGFLLWRWVVDRILHFEDRTRHSTYVLETTLYPKLFEALERRGSLAYYLDKDKKDSETEEALKVRMESTALCDDWLNAHDQLVLNDVSQYGEHLDRTLRTLVGEFSKTACVSMVSRSSFLGSYEPQIEKGSMRFRRKLEGWDFDDDDVGVFSPKDNLAYRLAKNLPPPFKYQAQKNDIDRERLYLLLTLCIDMPEVSFSDDPSLSTLKEAVREAFQKRLGRAQKGTETTQRDLSDLELAVFNSMKPWVIYYMWSIAAMRNKKNALIDFLLRREVARI